MISKMRFFVQHGLESSGVPQGHVYCVIISSMKSESQMIEGPEAFTRFENAMRVAVAVPHSEIKKRIEAHRQESEPNPNRRGPKPKQKGKRASGVRAV